MTLRRSDPIVRTVLSVSLAKIPPNSTGAAPTLHFRELLAVEALTPAVMVEVPKLLAYARLDFITRLAFIELGPNLGSASARGGSVPIRTSRVDMAQGSNSRVPASLPIEGKDFGYKLPFTCNVIFQVLHRDLTRKPN